MLLVELELYTFQISADLRGIYLKNAVDISNHSTIYMYTNSHDKEV